MPVSRLIDGYLTVAADRGGRTDQVLATHPTHLPDGPHGYFITLAVGRICIPNSRTCGGSVLLLCNLVETLCSQIRAEATKKSLKGSRRSMPDGSERQHMYCTGGDSDMH